MAAASNAAAVAAMQQASYRFWLSKDLNHQVKVKIHFLDGERPKEDMFAILDRPELRFSGLYAKSCADLYVTCQLFAGGKPLCLPRRTPYHSFSDQCRWNEWLVFPVKYRDLPRDAALVFEIWDVQNTRDHQLVGSTTFVMFSASGRMHRGRQSLMVHMGARGDGNVPSITAGDCGDDYSDEIRRLNKLLKKYESRAIEHVDWLDRLAFIKMEHVKQSIQRSRVGELFLHIEAPSFEFPVVFHELLSTPSSPAISAAMANAGSGFASSSSSARRDGAAISTPAPKDVSARYDDLMSPDYGSTYKVIAFEDSEMNRENPVELKHIKLARSQRRGLYDRDLKPNKEERERMNAIISAPLSKELSVADSELLWKFRYCLTKEKKALPKFLSCVDWTDDQQKEQANELLNLWQPIEPSEALALLGAKYKDKLIVRKYAISSLAKADDSELVLYLLPLFQALRYDSEPEGSDESGPLFTFLVHRAMQHRELCFMLNWYLQVEVDQAKKASTPTNFFSIRLGAFRRHLQSSELGAAALEEMARQKVFMERLSRLQKYLREMQVNRQKKISKLREALSDGGEYHILAKFPEPMALPLDPNVIVTGIIPETASLFKSAMTPLNLAFRTVSGGVYRVIFKAGDDMRQDQLVIALIRLMDNLLKRENVDLKLTPYRVLATSYEEGLVECIESQTIAAVLSAYDGDILRFLKEHNQDGSNQQSVIDTFVKSCAGYCVITYILGVGDRHLDNLLITTSGNLFHIDFGFILGRDPKYLPPPMKLCKEMVEGMGGASGPDYHKFKEHCCEAYNILRKSSNLILNLFQLMQDANIPDIAADPKYILKVQDKFKLENTDEQAAQAFQLLITESVSALFPQITETIHRWGQYWRS